MYPSTLRLIPGRQPKEKRRRSGAHEQSVRIPSKRHFAVQDNAVEHVIVGEQMDRSVSAVFAIYGLVQEFIIS